MSAKRHDHPDERERVQRITNKIIEYLGDETQKASHRRLTDEQQKMLSQFRVRLAGFDEDGELLGSEKLSEDLKEVQKIEAELVIDPGSIANQLKVAKEGGKPPFVKLGGHVNLNSIETLKEVMRHGYVILFELKGKDDQYHAVASIYGFHDSSKIPKEDFPVLQVENIAMPDARRSQLEDQEGKIVTNWRTSVRQSTESDGNEGRARRLGIGSMLKMVVAHFGKILLLNIGTIQQESLSIEEWIQGLENEASKKYNLNFMRSMQAKRNASTKIYENENTIGSVEWEVYIGICKHVREKIRKLLKAKGITQDMLRRLDAQSRNIKTILNKKQEEIRTMLDALDI